MPLSFQLYSAREVPDLPDFLQRLSRAGYAAVEGWPGVYDDAPAFRRALDDTGLAMPSGHFPLEWVRDDPARVRDAADALGMRAIFVPAVQDRVRDAEGWRALGTELAEAGERFWADGFTFGWHNHDFEFAPLEGTDTLPLELILQGDDRLAWEADLAWIARAGHDPADWIDRLAPRIAAAHVKDIAPEGEAVDEDGWADVGHGVMDWAGLKSRLAAAVPDALLVAEHDKPSDADRFASRSIDAFRDL